MTGESALDASALSSFRDAFSGDVVLPDDSDYDGARRVWNATADRHPAVVARCAAEADVAAAVRFAREHDLLVAVRGGAHSYPGFSTCDGGIVIDLSPLRGVRVDPEQRTALVAGGSLLGELDREAQAYGLVCPSGVVAHTGVAGLTLGGGFGRLMRKHGLTIDNLLAVELVTADGSVVRASERENPDLFWGLRGAGANFGIATSFEFRLHPLGHDVMAGIVAYPIDRAHEIGALFREYVASAPSDVSVSLGVGIAPTEPPFPAELAGQPMVVLSATHFGDPGSAERVLAPIRETGPLVDTFGLVSFFELQRSQDDYYGWGNRNYWKGLLLTDFGGSLIDVFVEELTKAPGSTCAFGVMAMGRAVGDVDEGATAFSGRNAQFWLLVESLWRDVSEDGAYFGWGRAAMDALRPLAAAANYVNDLGRSGDLRSVYGDAKYERLVALKRDWDPNNVFRLNQNIQPQNIQL
jgi:FAD/FMN-containing dehydrogenase